MDGAELSARIAVAARREAGRVKSAIRPTQWRRDDLASALRNPDDLGRDLRTALVRRDWTAAHRELVKHFATRPARFVLSPHDLETRTSRIRASFPDSDASAADRGNHILQGRYDLLGYTALSFDGEALRGASASAPSATPARSARSASAIDWHLDPVHGKRAPAAFWTRVPFLDPACGDHKIIWELNRHQHWLALGRASWLTRDRRYRDEIVRQLGSWMAANPPLVGINWASMLELAFRSLSWIWALSFLAAMDCSHGDDPGLRRRSDDDAAPWTVDLLLGLDRQLELVEQNLSTYFSPNTHLLGEALALYVAGRTLPELRRSTSWGTVGRDVLVDQISAQVLLDGGHAERSTHYHRYALDFYLLALAVARITRDSAEPVFARACAKLASFAHGMADPSGRLPAIGDDDGGMLFPICGRDPLDVSDSLQLAAHFLDQPALVLGEPAEEVLWMGADTPPRASRPAVMPSTAFPAAGYYVARSPRGDRMTIDAGALGFLNCGHAHADALSVTLSIAGRPFLIDPGTGCYTVEPATRDRFRLTPFHNTLTLDGRSQSEPDGPFRWRSAACAVARAWRTGRRFEYFEGTHDGYAPAEHERTVLARPSSWSILDSVFGGGSHRADVHWHVAPDWRAVVVDHRSLCFEHAAGGRVWMLSLGARMELFRGSDDPALGWISPAYGRVEPTTTVRQTRSGSAPFQTVLVIIDGDAAPMVEPIEIRTFERDAGLSMAWRVQTREWSDTNILIDRRACAQQQELAYEAGGMVADARMLTWRERRDGRLMSLAMVDGTQVRYSSGPAIVDCHARVPELELERGE
jgi:hypothetical protein